jgi:hypothetical protein
MVGPLYVEYLGMASSCCVLKKILFFLHPSIYKLFQLSVALKILTSTVVQSVSWPVVAHNCFVDGGTNALFSANTRN